MHRRYKNEVLQSEQGSMHSSHLGKVIIMLGEVSDPYLEPGGEITESSTSDDDVGTRHTVELPFLLVQQPVPAVDHSILDQLRHAERQSTHEVIT